MKDKDIKSPMPKETTERYRPGGLGLLGREVVKAKNIKGTLLRLWDYFKKEKVGLGIIFILTIISALMGLLAPYYIGKGIDVISSTIDFDKSALIVVGILLLIVYLLDAVITFMQGFMMARVSQRVIYYLRKSLFEKLQKLPLGFFDTHSHGELMSRLANDIDNISDTIASSMTQFISGVIMIVGAFVMMLILSPILTLAGLVPIPLMFILTRTITDRTKPLFRQQQEELGNLNGVIEESISGIHEVKAFNRENEIIDEFQRLNERLLRAGTKAQIWSGFLMPLMNVISNIGFAAVSYVGGYLAVKSAITLGIIASFISYSKQFTRPLITLSNIYNTLQTAIAGAERVFEILDEEEEEKDSPQAEILQNPKGDVSFKNVSFGYNEGNYILKDVSFDVKAGETVALVGSTGAGKTTIINLITRFYEVSKGSIEIDGKDIKKYTRESLRKSFGVVLQDTYLFSETIKNNIKYGNTEATDEEVIKAAKMSGAHNFIKNLPKGYDTIIIESGRNLSQGERQLLAITRAILSNNSILVLDEATSNVDTRTEKNIQKAMLKLKKGKTSFIIAHRLSTIRDADTIMVIDDGKVLEKGNHEKLIALGGRYKKMCMDTI